MFLRPALIALTLVALPAAAEEHITKSHGISAFGELKYPADFEHFDYVNPDAPKGGEMSFRGQLASQTFDSLNWFILKGEPAQGLELIYDSLLVRAYDEPDAVYGLVAESIEYPEDRSWVIYNLRPEARFADGEPITAEDVVFSLETLKTEANPNYRIALEGMESVEALSDHRVRVSFAEGAAKRDLASEVGTMSILPKHYYDTVPFTESTLEPPLGSGPYVISDVSAGRFVKYCRNPDYWAADLPVMVGHNNFDCVRYEYFGDNTAAFEALKSGEYLFHEEFSSLLWATNYDFPALDKGWIVRDEIPDGRSAGAQGFYLNMRRPVLQDPAVREALGMMFNFEWSNESLFYGAYQRIDSFWENTDMQASGLPEGEELAFLETYRDRLDPAIFNEPAVVPPVSSTGKTDRRLVRQALALLNEAGWTTGSDGLLRNAEGDTLKIEFLMSNAGFDRIILPFIENLETLGVDAAYTRIDHAEYEERLESFDFDITVSRLVLPLSPSTELRSVFGSAAVNDPGTFNLAGVADPVVDDMINRIIEADSRETLNTRVRALDRVLRAKHIWVPNWFKGTHWLAYWDVFGRPDVKPDFDRGDTTWWLDQAKYDALVAEGALR